MSHITEHAIEDEMYTHIEGCARDAAAMLGTTPDAGESEIVTAIDEFVFNWQKGERPDVPAEDDLSLTLGSLWGRQLVRKLEWQWSGVTFHDHGDTRAVGVFSQDRSLAIYPFHFLWGCF